MTGKAAGHKKPDKAKLYMEVATAIDGLHPRLPAFTGKFHVVEPQPGARLLLKENDRREVQYCSIEALGGEILRYCNSVIGKSRFLLTMTQAREAAQVWFNIKKAIPEPRGMAELSSTELAFHRLPFDLPPYDDLGVSPLFAEILSRCTNWKALTAFIGSLFDQRADRQQYLWVHGAGRNGKGALGNLLERTLGGSFHTDQVPDVRRGTSPFWTSSFLGKRLVLFPDCNSPQFPQSGLFKSMTGGDLTRIERKGKDAYSMRLNCKFMFFSNEELIISSQTADMRRAIYCHVDPITTVPDAAYYDKLWAEAPYILRDCIDVYNDLCPTHGAIPVEESLEHLTDLFDAKLDNFFHRYFVKTDDSSLAPDQRNFVSPGDMQSAFADAKIDNPREQNKYLDYFFRAYAVEKIDLGSTNSPPFRRRYVGLKKIPGLILPSTYRFRRDSSYGQNHSEDRG